MIKKTKSPVRFAIAAFLLVFTGLTAIQAKTVTREIPVSPGGLLEIDLETGGALEIKGGRSDVVVVNVEMRDKDADQIDLEIEPTRRGARIKTEIAAKRRGSSTRGLKVQVEVPPHFDLKIDTSGGGIQLSDIEGDLKGRTMGGNLTLTRLRGELNLKTMGGKIELTDSEVDGEVETMGGKVLLRDIIGAVKGSSMGGEVIYENVTRPDGTGTGGAVHMSTMGGRLEVDDAPEGAKLKTMGGNIRVGSAAEFVEAKTMGGNIEIGGIDGWVKAVTMGGDVDVTVVGGGGAIELQSMTGDIVLTVPDGLSMDIDIEIAVTRNRYKAGRYNINSDFSLDLDESDEWDDDHGTPRKYITGKATVGGGQRKVKVRTINGNVTLKRGG